MDRPTRVLLVEDDNSLGSTLKENLEIEGFSATWLKSGTKVSDELRSNKHDLLVLDVMLPGKSGIEVLQELRKFSSIPVLMISAKGSSQDRIEGLKLEADDYLPKPFHLEEFLLRVKSLVRRSLVKSEKPSASKFELVVIGLAEFDFKLLEVKTGGHEPESLTQKELGILRTLLENVNNVITRDQIIQNVWGNSEYPSTRTVDNFIVRLRKWIEIDPAEPKYIISHRGIGYSLRLENPNEQKEQK